LSDQIKTPVKIAKIETLSLAKHHFVRVTSTDGATGLAMTNERAEYLFPLLQQRVAPFFVGKNAVEIEALVDAVYVHQSNYKLAGLALWNCVGWIEFAIFDLLGKVAGKSVGDLLGGVKRKDIPVYLSSMRRDTTPEQEIEWMAKRIAESSGQAVKLKIGGRMSRNADASPGRSEKLVALARKTWGDQFTIFVDANGSYDAPTGIKVGKMLETHQVAMYEEPCPWEDFAATKQVTDALDITVAGGEQDTSYEKFQWYVRNQGLDILQPDVNYNGGFVRTLRVARLAEAAGLKVVPHAPQAGMATAYMLHFISVIPNAGPYQEYNAAPRQAETWFHPNPEPKNSKIAVPTGPGLGVEIDAGYLKKSVIVETVTSSKR
jgi:L-alanine-DL-glutamate epimerase-like enolase superfamily enzyme